MIVFESNLTTEFECISVHGLTLAGVLIFNSEVDIEIFSVLCLYL